MVAQSFETLGEERPFQIVPTQTDVPDWNELPVAGRFPPESEDDNVEYKWKLMDLSQEKFGKR
jgi:hypothetical protein